MTAQTMICPIEGWVEFGDDCYLFMGRDDYGQGLTNWDDAKVQCELHSATLASIHSEEEDNFIFENMKSIQPYYDYWCGLHQINGGLVILFILFYFLLLLLFFFLGGQDQPSLQQAGHWILYVQCNSQLRWIASQGRGLVIYIWKA